MGGCLAAAGMGEGLNYEVKAMTNLQKIAMFALGFCVLSTAITFAESQAQNTDHKQPAYLKTIPPDKLKEDLDFLFKTIGQVHPDMYAYTKREKYALAKNELYKQIDHDMSISEFYLYVRTVVICLNDSHTRIQRPSTFIMPPITEPMLKFQESLKELVKDDGSSKTDVRYISPPRKKEYTEPYSYHIFPEYDACFMVINSFGKPDKLEQYANKFKETFKVIKEKGITHLIIDVRENQGGSGLTGDEILKYLAKQPFHQIEKVEQRLVPALFDLCEQYGLDINKIMADEYGIDLENLKSKGDYKSGITVAGQVPFKNPHESSDRFKGSVYLLIAKPTFSAASNFAAAVKYFRMGTLIGQETSGEKDHYGQVLPIQLPHSGLKGQVSTAHFIAVGGMEDPGGVKPDYEIKQTFKDKMKGRDTVLEFTLNLIKNNRTVSDTKSKG
jgi:hypothetical protein